MNTQISDNIISGTTAPYYIEDASNGSASGVNNWLPTKATVGALLNTVQSASPGFVNTNTAVEDYHLAAGSVCIGAADTQVYGLPGREYFYNETTNLMWRPRAAARDIGAFESTSPDDAVGPYDAMPQPSMSITANASDLSISWPLFAQDFQIDQSSLAEPPMWTPASLTLTTNAANVAAIIPIGSTRRFYRLRQ
jgi:hypothetical protein